MNNDILELVPEQFKCPYCGQWHDIDEDDRTLGEYSEDYPLELTCHNDEVVHPFDKDPNFQFYIGKDDLIHVHFDKTCRDRDDSFNGVVPLSSIVKSTRERNNDKLASEFYVELSPTHENACSCSYHNCNFFKLDYSHTSLGFTFDKNEYLKISHACNAGISHSELTETDDDFSEMEEEIANEEENLSEEEEELAKGEENLTKQAKTSKMNNPVTNVKKQKEDLNMKSKVSNLWAQVYEHSPKENVDIAKRWLEKYKPTLKWAVPVVSIYAAYKILNSKNSPLSVENIDKTCQEKLGFKLDFLENKQKLNELMALGKIAALAYGAIKVASSIYGKNEDLSEISAEQIEEDMNKLDSARKKYGWIQPKTEAMLPVALSVITVYVMTQKPAWFKNVQEKVTSFTGRFGASVSVYWDMLKLFVADKLHIDLNTEEGKQKAMKFVFLGLILAIGAFIYGKKVLVKRNADEDTENLSVSDIFSAEDDEDEDATEDSNGIKAFMRQILAIMKKLIPVTFASAGAVLVAKKIKASGQDDVIDVESSEVTDSEDESDSDENDFDEIDSDESDADEIDSDESDSD